MLAGIVTNVIIGLIVIGMVIGAVLAGNPRR